MRKRLGGLALAGAVLLLARPAAAQEWRIHLLGKTEPIVASFYAEEPPWVFYRDDDSIYVFAVGCDRIARVERGGTEIPRPACPVDLLPTTMPRVLLSITDLEAKRLDDSIARLREQTRAYAEAVIGGAAATRGFIGQAGPAAQEDVELARARVAAATAFLQSQINDTLFEIQLTQQRVGALLDAAKAFPPRPRPRYFFAPR